MLDSTYAAAITQATFPRYACPRGSPATAASTLRNRTPWLKHRRCVESIVAPCSMFVNTFLRNRVNCNKARVASPGDHWCRVVSYPGRGVASPMRRGVVSTRAGIASTRAGVVSTRVSCRIHSGWSRFPGSGCRNPRIGCRDRSNTAFRSFSRRSVTTRRGVVTRRPGLISFGPGFVTTRARCRNLREYSRNLRE